MNWKIKHKSLIYLALLIPYMMPQSVVNESGIVGFVIIDYISNVARIISAFYIILAYLKRKNPSIDLIACVFFYSSFLVFSSCLKGADILTSIIICITRTTLCMLITLMIIDNELNVVAEYGKFIILVNFVCMLIWPNGIWRRIYFTANEPVFFIGHKNFLDLFVLFILLFIFLQNKKTSLSYWIYYILSVISVFMSKSSTGTVVMLFSFIISIFYWEKLYKILLNDKLIYIITFIISILITLTPTILTNNRYIQELIIKGFHKDLTLSYRTILWEKAWEYIARSPIIGWGQNLVFREYSNNISNPAHNAMLQVLISTGIVGVVLLFVLYFKCSKRMVDKLDNEKTHIQINLCILMFMLIGIMEPTVLTGHYLFVLMVLQYHSNRNKI